MKRLIEIVVDLQNKIYNTVFLKQMDTTVIQVKLLDNNIIVDFASQTVDIIFTKPDNTIVQQVSSNIDKTNGIATIPLLADCVRQAGKAKMEIEVKNTNSEVISSFYIPVQIEQTSKENVNSDNTPNYFEEFAKAIDDLKSDSTQMLNDISSAEEKRVSNEKERVSAENTRKSNETNREDTESARNTAEEERVSNENTRISNEKSRVSAENTRKTNETNRTTAETARVKAEEARVTAEENRVTEFNQMMQNVNAEAVQKNTTDIAGIKDTMPNNAGSHNGIYRGKEITDLFYDGTLTKQIAAGTFDDIFVGDYIIGKVSGRKYLVADINYRLHCGDTECTKPHILMIPEKTMGNAQMNSTNITTGAYVGSEMYITNLETYKTVIKNDFGTEHILKHRELFSNAVTNGYESAGSWYDSEIDLMNELMVYGSNIFHNCINGTNIPYNYTIDKSQLSLFRHRPDLIPARNDSNGRQWYWLRDVVSSADFASVYSYGCAYCGSASSSGGVRPAFLIY